MRGLTPETLEARVHARLDARLERDTDRPLALALSGGGDSMALLGLTAAWAARAGRRVVAITVDHGLSPDSSAWSGLCERAARAVGADWVERRWNGEKPITGIPAAARAARHALIAEAARAAGARVVLFAHTADDIAESEWMRARGSTLGTLREWSPSPAWPEGRGLMLLRPLLEEAREGLRDWLRTQGQGWIEDPGNEDSRFGRTRARQFLNPLPLGEGLRLAERSDAPSRKGEGLNPHREALAPHPFAQGRSQAIVRSSPSSDRMRSFLHPLGEGFAIERLAVKADLAATLLCASGGITPPRGERLARLSARLASGDDFIATLAGARIEARSDRVVTGREPGELRRRPPADVSLTPGVPAVWDGRYEVVTAAPGLTVTAAAGRLARLSAADRQIVSAVPGWARGALPVLIRDDGTAPVLAWRQATVRALGPRRLALTLGETTHERDLDRSIHGETPPTDLFSIKELHKGGPDGRPRDRETR